MNKRERKNPKIRKQQILNAAIELAIKIGYQNITRVEIANNAGVSVGLVSNYFITMHQLKAEVMKTAIQKHIYEIIAQGLIIRDKTALKISRSLKDDVIKFLNK